MILFLAYLKVLGVGQALLCIISAEIIRAGIGWYWMRGKVDFSLKADVKVIHKLLLMGIKLSWADLMILLNGQLNILLVKYLLDNFESVGYFSRGQRVAMLTVTAGQAVLPLLFSKWASFPEDRLRIHVEKVMRFASTLGFMMIVGVLVFGRWIILILYGKEFIPATIPMMILVPGTMLYLLSRTFIQLLSSRGVPEISGTALLCSAIFNAVLSWVLIPIIGINGAAIAASAANILLLIILAAIVKVKYEVRLTRCILVNRTDIGGAMKSIMSRS